MTLEPPVARYRQIADQLRRRILAGEFTPGAQLPSETELRDLYGVSRVTVRNAVRLLVAEGLVDAEHGRGVFVRRRPHVRLAFSRYHTDQHQPGLGPFESTLASMGLSSSVVPVMVEQSTADEDIAARLEVTEGAPVVLRVRHMAADGAVVQVQHNWFPLDLVDGTELARPEKVVGGIYPALARIGHPVATVTEEITARMPLPEEAEVLGAAVGVPVLVLWRVSRDQGGRAVEAVRIVALADRTSFRYEDLPVT